MSCKELIDSLKKAADERVRQLWQDAEAEAARISAELAHRTGQLRTETDRNEARLAGDAANLAVAEARNRARMIRLSAEQLLSERLYAAAKEMLWSFRDGSYEKRFGLLAAELPQLEWEKVRVNPQDAGLARRHFPGALVAADSAVSGGMEVTARNGAIRIDNTFEKRLQRAWGDLQPNMISDAYREVKDEAVLAAAGGQGVSRRVSSVEDQGKAVATDR